MRKEVTIQSQVLAVPGMVRLPWTEGHSHEYTLKAIGGGDKYNWHSDKTLTTVNPSGVLSVHGVGTATVKVSDKKNPLNFANVMVLQSI